MAGTTTVINCKMIDAEMYGMIPSAKMLISSSAPPVNRLISPRKPPPPVLTSFDITERFTPGTVMKTPMR